jgi:hypothetical protein
MLNQMKMETRLHAGFGGIVLLVVLLGVIAFSKLTSLHENWHEFETVTLVRKNAVLEGVGAHGRAVHHFKNYILRGPDSNPVPRRACRDRQADGGLPRGRPLSPEEQALLGEIRRRQKL